MQYNKQVKNQWDREDTETKHELAVQIVQGIFPDTERRGDLPLLHHEVPPMVDRHPWTSAT